MEVHNPQKVYNQVVRSITSKDLDDWEEMESQGRWQTLHIQIMHVQWNT